MVYIYDYFLKDSFRSLAREVNEEVYDSEQSIIAVIRLILLDVRNRIFKDLERSSAEVNNKSKNFVEVIEQGYSSAGVEN